MIFGCIYRRATFSAHTITAQAYSPIIQALFPHREMDPEELARAIACSVSDVLASIDRGTSSYIMYLASDRQAG